MSYLFGHLNVTELLVFYFIQTQALPEESQEHIDPCDHSNLICYEQFLLSEF